MQKGMNMLLFIIVFLSSALALFVTATAVFAARCRVLHEKRDELDEIIEHQKNSLTVQIALNRDLKREKALMLVTNEELKSDNDRLADAVRELREINKQLSAPAEPLIHPKERLPQGVATNRFDCEGYAFPEGTQQARLQNECFTDTITGARIYDLNNSHYYANGYVVSGYYCVAMGTAYGVDIGDTWYVKLKNGNGFNIILADYQHDISDPDPDDFGERFEYDANGNKIGLLRNYDGKECVHVLEFIVDLEKLPQEAKGAGGMHGLDFFGGKFGDGGNIVKIEYLGRKWEP